jgi:hypothetical protein
MATRSDSFDPVILDPEEKDKEEKTEVLVTPDTSDDERENQANEETDSEEEKDPVPVITNAAVDPRRISNAPAPLVTNKQPSLNIRNAPSDWGKSGERYAPIAENNE